MQERFKSNLEIRYQIIVSSIKFRKDLAKFMIPIALFNKFLSKQFIGSVVVSNMARCSYKTNELRDIDSLDVERGTSPSKNGKFTISKSKSSRLS